MKNLLCLLTSLLIFTSVNAQTSFDSIDTSCFEKRAVITGIEEIKAIEIMTPFSQFFPIQDWEILDQKFNKAWNNLNSYLINLKTTSKLEIFSSYKCLDNIKFKVKFANYISSSLSKQYNTWENLLNIIPFFDENPNFNTDIDKDWINNENDNCQFISNQDQLDSDENWIWDLCEENESNPASNSDNNDIDSDNDKIKDWMDNCINVSNPYQKDSNNDGKWDLCSDDDNDGIIGHLDNCIWINNPDQKDSNNNNVWDLCDKTIEVAELEIIKTIVVKNEETKNTEVVAPINTEVKKEKKKKTNSIIDSDQDWVAYFKDNCKEVRNPDQKDQDNDKIWDECDNCPSVKNKDQIDKNNNWVWDICEDSDKDWIVDIEDNCASIANKNQKDSNNNSVWDICEDLDRDWILSDEDNCPKVYNVNQTDTDKDWIWDKCDDISSISNVNRLDKQ